MKKTAKHYLEDIITYIVSIETALEDKNELDFMDDTILRDAIVKRIENIGEIAKRIPPIIVRNYPEIPWKDMAGMRDKLAHDYDMIDYSLVWLVIQNDLPDLKYKLENIIRFGILEYEDD